MSVPSANEQLLLGTHPQQTEVHFDIFNPATVLSASVNNSSAAQGDRVITYDNATGDFNDVKPGMTLYAANEFVRVVSATATTITVAENDYIVWTNNLAFTVRAFYLPWGVLPRISIDSNDIVTFFKDFDIEYSNQNSVLDPVVHMGPNAAALLDQDSGAVDVFYTSSGSFDPNGSGLSTFSWNFEGAQITGTSAADPGNVAYDTPGDFITTLTVTNNASKSFTAHRHILIRNSSRPAWGLNSLEGNKGSGSWQASLWVRNDVSDVVDGALVILHTTDFYGTTKQSIGGNAQGRNNTLFVGYIYGESIRYDATDNIVTFTVFGLGAYLNTLETMSARLEDKATATTWNEMTSLNIDRALFGFIRWQTNIMEVADVFYTNNTFPVQFIDFARGPILASLRNLVMSAIKGLVNSDRQGALYIEEDVQTVEVASRNIPITMELSRQFWMNEPEIQHRKRRVQSFLELGGILYSGATGTFAAMLSGAPGITPSYFGSTSREHGLIIGPTGQTFLNAFTGNVFALRNNPFPEVAFEMAGNLRVFDIAPQEFTQAILSADDTFSDVVWNPQRLIPLRVEYTYNPETFSLLPTVSFEAESSGPPGQTIIIPPTPPWDPPELPEIPIQPIPVPVPPVAGNASHVFFMTDNDEIVWSGDIFSTLASQPTWNALGVGSGLPGDLDALWDTGGGNRGWLAVIWDTSRAYVIGRVSTASPTDKPWAIWQTTNILDSSPVWVELLRGGDSVLGSTVFVDPGNGSPFSRLHRQGNSVYLLIRLTSGGESHSRHDGAAFTHTAISIAQNVQTEVATEAAYTDESGGSTRVFNPIGTVLASFVNNEGVNRTIWRNYAGGSYFTFRSNPTGDFLHNANSDSDVVQFSGLGTGANTFTEIRGALNGNALCFVGGDDQAWVSADGSTFTTGTLVWEEGQIDFLDVGGGDQLAWLPYSVANSQEMFRLADDIFGSHAFFNKTGNYWTEIDISGGAFLATRLQVTYE
jgi:hypothetical protein